MVWYGFEFVLFVFFGFFGGVYGGLFIKVNMWVVRWRKLVIWFFGLVI